MKVGLLEILAATRFFVAPGGNYAELKAPAAISSNFTLTLPTALPGSTQGLQVNSSGQLSYFTPTTGTVTSVALSAPSIFNVGGSPVTTSGTLALSLANQAANTVFAAPAGGGAPTFRGLAVTDFATLPRLDQWAAPTSAVSMNNQQLTNLAEPTAPQHAATKNYVDIARQGLDVKDSVRAISLVNVNVASPGATHDGVTLAAGDRLLLAGQTTASQNGPYIFNGATSPLTRAADSLNANAFFFVEEGTTYGDSGWTLSTNNPITVGTTNLTFAQFSQAGTIYDGNGLVKTGNTISVGTASSSRIVVNADNIDLATTGIAAGAYFRTTVDTYGRVTVGENPTTLAGFGIIDAQPLDSDLTAVAALTTNGIIARTGNGTATTRTVAGTSGQVAVTNGDGVAGNPTVALVNTGVSAGTYNSVTVDVTGRVTAASNVGYGTVARRAFANSDLVAGVLTFNHGLGQKIVKVSVSDGSDQIVLPDNITLTNSNACAIDLSSFAAGSGISGTWNVIAIG